MRTLLALMIGLTMLVSTGAAVNDFYLPRFQPIGDLTADTGFALPNPTALPEIPDMVLVPPEPPAPPKLPTPPELPALPMIGTSPRPWKDISIIGLFDNPSYNWQMPFDSIPTDEPEAEDPNEPVQETQVVQEAGEWLADYLGVTADLVVATEVTEEVWPDGCLGLPGPHEACTMALVQGYKIIFNVNGEEYEVRTDMNATRIRVVE